MDLTSAWQKLTRAQRHIDELDREIKTFTKSDPYAMGWEARGDEVYELVVARAKPAPVRLSLAAGDAIHNLRSALDHAVWELAGDKAHKGSGFPVQHLPRYKTEASGLEVDRWPGVASNMLRGLTQAQIDTIEAMQPYHARDLTASDLEAHPTHPLALNVMILGLHRINNMDKHQRVLGPYPFATVRLHELVEDGAVRDRGAPKLLLTRMEAGAVVVRINLAEFSRRPAVQAPTWTLLFGEAVIGESMWDHDEAALSATDIRIAEELIRQALVRLGAA